MPVTSFSPLLGLALPTTGDLSGTWGTTVNDSITSLLDTAVAGTTTLSTDGDVTLSTTNGAANQARSAVLLCSGARTAQRTITAPAQSKAYIVINNTTGGFAVKVVGAGPTTGVTIANGEKALIAWNGSDFVLVSAIPIDLTTDVTGTLPVANGGTGQTSYTNGQLLIGNTTGNTLTKSTLTAGSGISITNGTGSITIAATGGTGTVSSVSGTGTVQGLTLSGTVTSSGSLTLGGSLSAVSLTSQVSGTLPVANGGTGLSSTPTNGQLDIGNGTGFTRAALTQGSGISITNGSGSITVANSGVTSVAAGTGISVSGSTGAVTITSTVTSPTGSTMVAAAIYISSSTFVAPKTGRYTVTVVGGGGGGGAACASNVTSSPSAAAATGGGGGGFAKGVVNLTAGTSYTVTIGAGGAGALLNGVTDGTAIGTTGGTSSFSGSGITTLTATGGSGGSGSTGGGGITGASGGTASGGSLLNINGGGSGSITYFSGNDDGAGATGGGSSAWYGVAFASGYAVVRSGQAVATGGAGAGGISGNLDSTSTSSGQESGGGGSLAAGESRVGIAGSGNTAGGAGLQDNTTTGSIQFNYFTGLPWPFSGRGGSNGSATSPGGTAPIVSSYGAGGSGRGRRVSSSTASGFSGFAGGGGGNALKFTGANGTQLNVYGAQGYFSAGGGGSAACNANYIVANNYVEGGLGGNGMVIIEWAAL